MKIEKTLTDENGVQNTIIIVDFEDKIENAKIVAVREFVNNGKYTYQLTLDKEFTYLTKEGTEAKTNAISKSFDSIERFGGDVSQYACLNAEPCKEFVKSLLMGAVIDFERTYHEKDELNAGGQKYEQNTITNHVTKCVKTFSPLNHQILMSLKDKKREKVTIDDIWETKI